MLFLVTCVDSQHLFFQIKSSFFYYMEANGASALILLYSFLQSQKEFRLLIFILTDIPGKKVKESL